MTDTRALSGVLVLLSGGDNSTLIAKAVLHIPVSGLDTETNSTEFSICTVAAWCLPSQTSYGGKKPLHPGHLRTPRVEMKDNRLRHKAFPEHCHTGHLAWMPSSSHHF